MHFYYIDEAGCNGQDLSNPEQPIFVLGGVSVRDEGWHITNEELSEILGHYFSGNIPTSFELHAEQLLSPEGDGPFHGHPRENRNELAKKILNILITRRHDVHLYAIDKRKLIGTSCHVDVPFDLKTPYCIAYDYIITNINWIIKNKLGQSARGMLIIDKKDQFETNIEKITHARRAVGPIAHRVKRVVEYSYPVDSFKNPMIQLSDLIVFCSKKFLEIDNGYRDNYPQAAKRFFAECYSIIHERIPRKEIVEREGRGLAPLNEFLREIQSKPLGQWRRRYGL